MTIRLFCTLLAASVLACLVEASPALAGSGSSFAQASSRGSIVASKSCTDRLGSGEVVLVEEREHFRHMLARQVAFVDLIFSGFVCDAGFFQFS